MQQSSVSSMKFVIGSSPVFVRHESAPTGEPYCALRSADVSATESPGSWQPPWNVWHRPLQWPTSWVAVSPRLSGAALPPAIDMFSVTTPSRRMRRPAAGRPMELGAVVCHTSHIAIPTLTDEQVTTWTLAQKDRWWLDHAYKGHTPHLTLRSAATGFLLGGLLSVTNLYVGAKTGWTLGVGLTSVILAFAMFKVFARLGSSDMWLLENNAMQSVATAAGCMTGPLISGMAAFMWIEDRTLPRWQIMAFNAVLSLMGVLVGLIRSGGTASLRRMCSITPST